MSSNIQQLFTANPVTVFNADDLFYIGQTPFAATDDGATKYSSLIPVNTKGDLFTWSTVATKLAVGSDGQLLQAKASEATGLVWTTATYPETTTANQILYSSATNTVGGLATANDSVLVTSATGVPSFGSSLPIGVQNNITQVGTITSGTWQANVLGETFGGTGIATYTVGDILYSSATDTLAKLAGNTTTGKQFLSQTGDGVNSAAPVWEVVNGSDITGEDLTKVDDTNITLTLGGTPTGAVLNATSITAGWTGTLAPTRGGTGQSTYTDGQLLIGNTTGNTLAKSTLTGTANQVNVTNGAGSITLSLPQDIATTSDVTFDDLTLTSGLRVGFAGAPAADAIQLGDDQFYFAFASGNPFINFDANDFIRFTRASNMFDFQLAATSVLTAIPTNINIKQNAFIGGIGTANSQLQLPADFNRRKLTIYETNNNDHEFLGFGVEAGGLNYQVAVPTDNHRFYAGTSSTTSQQLGLITGTKNWVIADAAVGTTATDGFLYITSCPGVPTGTPTAFTGRTANVYDSTNNEAYIYNGAWRHPVGNRRQTWSPVISDGTNNFTMGTQIGEYVKIGNMIQFWMNISWTSKGSATGNIQISLPEALGANNNRAAFSLGFLTNITCTTFLTCGATTATSFLQLFKFNSAAGSTVLTDADYGATGDMQVTGCYWTA